jgi:hypothetical protein
MSRARTSVAAGLGALAVLATTATIAAPAEAKVLERGRFHDVFVSDPYDCGGTMAVDDIDVRGSFTGVVRGSSPFPHYVQHVMGRVITTNLDTGGTLTQVFSNNFKDHSITDIGDGTITLVTVAAGGTRYYDQDGRFVLKDPGSVWFSVDINYHDTPGDPSDDTVVPDSSHLVKPSTGNSDFPGRDFCDDLRTFTTP